MRVPRLISVLVCWLTAFNLLAQEKISCLPPNPASHPWFNISDVIWSAVLASTVTVTGVLISDWKSTRRTRMQLAHDARERDRERKSALRKEVYLTAAEEQAKAHQYFSALPQADLTDPAQVGGMTGFFASAAKVQLVCDPKTYTLVSDLVIAYGSLLLRLLEKVSPIHSIRDDIKIRTHHIDRYTVEVDRILAMISANNESGAPDPNKMRTLQNAFEFNQGQAKKISDERNILFKERDSLNINYAIDLMREIKELLPLQIRASNAIRRELNLECDSDEILSKMADEHLKQMTAQLDSLLRHLQGDPLIPPDITPQA